MVNEITYWQDLDARLGRAFSPTNPINRKDFFQGRAAAVRRVIDAANQTGQHVIIYGERGVGKTSLANVLHDYLAPFTSETIASFRVNCFRDSSYASIWNEFLRHLDVEQVPPYEKLTPNDVLAALRHERRKIILIVDEFDRIQGPDVHALFADTIKALSDFEIDTTLIVVGVADDVDDLISEHPSIDRCLAQVRLDRMKRDELSQIVIHGMQTAGMSVSADAVSTICTLSLGLPHYTHALGLASGRAAIDSERTHVEAGDVDEAIKTLIADTQQTIIGKFDLAVASPRRENYYLQVLLACALSPTDHIGCFRAADIRDPYAAIQGQRFEIPSYSRHLHDLSTQARGEVLQKSGSQHNIRFRFTDPMMQPFVVMQGLTRQLIQLGDVGRWSGLN